MAHVPHMVSPSPSRLGSRVHLLDFRRPRDRCSSQKDAIEGSAEVRRESLSRPPLSLPIPRPLGLAFREGRERIVNERAAGSRDRRGRFRLGCSPAQRAIAVIAKVVAFAFGSLRVSEEDESQGLDVAEHGEEGYIIE